MNTFLAPLSLERETECLKKVAQNDKEAKDEAYITQYAPCGTCYKKICSMRG